MEEYITINELSSRIKYSKQSIYNLIHQKILVRQVHYFKPTPKKLLFKWDAIQGWIEGEISVSDATNTTADTPPSTANPQATSPLVGRINI
ncbi:MAG: hypothetical protein KKI15_02395 [Proteobacteria bacterium]|nr:hypothetical protein [Pseudomonadota bacterium]